MIEFKISGIVERDDGSREISFRIMRGKWTLQKNPDTGKLETVFVRDACFYHDTVTLGMNTTKVQYAAKFLTILRAWAAKNGYGLGDLFSP